MNLEPPSNSPVATKTISVLIVEDHVVTRVGLRTLLSGFSQISVVGEAGSVATALVQLSLLNPDVMLLDVRLPDGNAFEVCRHLQTLNLKTQVLILTSYADDDTIFQSIAAGADGYLLKEIDGDGLVHAIENVAAGRSILDPSVTRRVLSRVRFPGVEAQTKSKVDLLSVQERRVLELVAQGKTNKEIAVEMGLSDKTVKNYLSNTLEKLDVSRRSEAAVVFVRSGRV